MAQKRMFDKKVVGSDKFIDLPNSSKALYFMAGMEADDKGFFQPRKLQRMCGFSDDDYKILIAKGFFITFESGVMVVTDWNKNNWLDSRRITETEYVDELNMLKLINDRYERANTTESKCLADAKPTLREYSIVENSIVENSSSCSIEKEQQLQQLFIRCTGSTNLNAIEECISYLNDLPYEVIEIALKKASEKNGGWKYAKTILQNWLNAGIKTIEQVEAEELRFKNKTKKSKTTEDIINELFDEEDLYEN